MKNEIKLLNELDRRGKTDLELIEEFLKYLQGKPVDGILDIEPKLNLTIEQAGDVIGYLQGHLSVFPDHIYQCSNCGGLYDCDESGHTSEINDKSYCDSCEHLAPDDLEQYEDDEDE